MVAVLLRPLVALLPVALALILCDSAAAHATLSPPEAKVGTSQLFTLGVPTDAVFQFLAEPGDARYSDGSVVDWSGPGAPAVEARDSLRGGGGGALTIVALALGALGLLAGLADLARAGGRELV